MHKKEFVKHWSSFSKESPEEGLSNWPQDYVTCPDCLSGQRDCIPDAPVCFVDGECEGVVDHVEVAPSAEACLDLCNSTFGCRWFTFYGDESECNLFESCPTLDELACYDCISGERRCADETTTTTTTETSSQSPSPSKCLFQRGNHSKLDMTMILLTKLNQNWLPLTIKHLSSTN